MALKINLLFIKYKYLKREREIVENLKELGVVE